MKILHVLTVPASLGFFRGQPAWFRAQGVELSFVCAPGEAAESFAAEQGCEVRSVAMERRIDVRADLRAVRQLRRIIREVRPDVVHSHTPKGGLLGTLAAAAAGARHRVYHIHGLPFVTATGLQRLLLTTTERVSCTAATEVLCVSEGVRAVARKAWLTHRRIRVLGKGSINGVDAHGRFEPAAQAPLGVALRALRGIPAGALVFGFVGRLVGDKGVNELARAWAIVRKQLPEAHLLVCGDYEPRDPVPPATRSMLDTDDHVHMLGFVGAVEEAFAAMDVLVLPTYREGFPVVPLEAASMALPVVSTLVPGAVDAVVDGRTGTLVPARAPEPLAQAMLAYADDSLRQAHGQAGRDRVLADYRQERVWRDLLDFYRSLSAAQRGATAPQPAAAW